MSPGTTTRRVLDLGRGRGRVPGRVLAAAGCAATSLFLLLLVGALGESAAVPGLGPATWHPPWDLAARAPSALVTVLLWAGYGLGGVAVWLGLRAVREWQPPTEPARLGARVGARVGVRLGICTALLFTLVPPVGSADHLSYVAYGRIAAAGDDPYSVPPIGWRGGRDPVAGAVQPPWQRTPSVYGPVATAGFALVAVLGGGSLRLTVWWWQLVCAAAFAAVALLLDRLTRGDPARRRRALVLWTLNPLLLGQLVLGAHVDVLAAAFALGALAALARRPLIAGVLLGAAVGTKAPYGLLALAALWGIRHLPRRSLVRSLVWGGSGAVMVLVPAQLWAGPHVVDQLRAASGFTSIASPWRALVNLVELGLGSGALRGVVVPLSLLAAALLVAPLGRRLSARLEPDGVTVPGRPAERVTVSGGAADRVTGSAARAAVALCASWVLLAPYALPWYDAIVWAPLALVAPVCGTGVFSVGVLEAALLGRLTVLALAYAPGRVVGLAPGVESLTLGVRRYLAPVLVLAVIVLVARWAVTGRPASPVEQSSGQ